MKFVSTYFCLVISLLGVIHSLYGMKRPDNNLKRKCEEFDENDSKRSFTQKFANLKIGSDRSFDSMNIVIDGQINTTNSLINNGMKILPGKTPLIEAIKNKESGLIKEIIKDNSTLVTQADASGNMPLYYAVCA